MRTSWALLLLMMPLAGCGGGAPPGDRPMAAGASEAGAAGAFDGGAPVPGADGGAVTPPADPCAAATLGDGAYCGSSLGAGDAATLYQCAGGKTVASVRCALGCHVAPPGTPDSCEDDGVYHLPWACGAKYECTQGNHGDICGGGTGDHTGVQEYAWDFGLPRHTPVLAARGGVVTVAANVTGPGQACYDGCTQPFGSDAFWACCNGCLNTSNHVNVQHADGTVATYWHLDVATVHVGDRVAAGDALGYSGTSGCSSGPHLHFQVMGDCPTGYCQSQAVAFANDQKPICGNVETSDNACHQRRP